MARLLIVEFSPVAMLHILRVFLLLSFTSLFISLSAAPRSSLFDPYGDPRWGGGPEFIGEYLYLRPTLCDLDFVISDPRDFTEGSPPEITLASLPQGLEQGLEPTRGSGFRLGYGGVSATGCTDFSITYAALWADDQQKFIAPVRVSEEQNAIGEPIKLFGGLWPTFGHPALLTKRLNDTNVFALTIPEIQHLGIRQYTSRNAAAKPRLKVAFNSAEILIGLRRIWGCDVWVHSYVGVRWAAIRVRQVVDYQGIAVFEADPGPFEFQFQQHRVRSKSKSWGAGPRAGFDLRLDIAQGVGIGAHVGGSLLAGGRRNDFRHDFVATEPMVEGKLFHRPPSAPSHSTSSTGEAQQDQTPTNRTVSVGNRQWFALIPQFDARFGVNYLSCCGARYSLFIEVGYQFSTYLNAVLDPIFDHSGGTRMTTCRSFSLDGFYVSSRIRF